MTEYIRTHLTLPLSTFKAAFISTAASPLKQATNNNNSSSVPHPLYHHIERYERGRPQAQEAIV